MTPVQLFACFKKWTRGRNKLLEDYALALEIIYKHFGRSKYGEEDWSRPLASSALASSSSLGEHSNYPHKEEYRLLNCACGAEMDGPVVVSPQPFLL